MTERQRLGDFGERAAKVHLCQRSLENGVSRSCHTRYEAAPSLAAEGPHSSYNGLT